jgi:soluble cytochrome b562
MKILKNGKVSKESHEAYAEVMKRISEMKEDKTVKGIDFSDEVKEDRHGIEEMIGTSDGAAEFLQKVTYDSYQGREAINLLYSPIYTTKSDANFPQVLIENEFGPVSVVFLEKFEGGEVKFGTLEPGQKKIINFTTWAAGVEYDEDILEYNQTWKVTEIGTAFGESYNKLLNHLHLWPIINGSYTTTGGDIEDQRLAQNGDINTPGIAQEIEFDTDIETTLRDAITVLPKGAIVLANPGDKFEIEDAIYGSLYADLKTPSAVRRQINPDNIIYYEGSSVVVGGKEYVYGGVTVGTLFLIAPDKKNFIEYIKHDLRVDSNDGDLSRLIISQVVGRARRAQLVVLGTKFGAVKVNIANGS